ncbi:isoprenoid biosynthesis glyoxalase ElbB [bacterium]|nr:isoprenoid biosynthesis glyoxalase ElbB [bacterium]
MAKVGVLLSGLGHSDGSDIQETVLVVHYLSQAGAEVIFLAPDEIQQEVIDHHTGKLVDERRNILVESARIAGPKIKVVDQVNPSELDALIIPGGLGVVKNLCNFLSAGENCRVNEQVRHLVGSMVRGKRPVGVLSMAAVLLARVLKSRKGITPTLTVGSDAEMAGKIQAMGAIHVSTKMDEALIDDHNRLISTPASLSGTGIGQMAQGIKNLVRGTLEFVHKGVNHAGS